MVTKWWFPNSIILSTFITWHASIAKAFPLLSLICLYQYGLVNSYFIQWIIYHSLLSFFFWYSYCPRFDLWEPLQIGFCMLFTCPVIVWVHPYTRGKIQDVLGSFGNHTAPRESKTSLTLVHVKAKIWGLGVVIVIGISWLCRPQQAEQGNMCL